MARSVIPAEAGIQKVVASEYLLGPRLREDDGASVIPAEAGIQKVVAINNPLGPRLRGDDERA